MVKKKSTKDELILDSKPSENIVTYEQLIKAHNVSLDEWNVAKKILNKWEVSKKDESGILQSIPMYQVKIYLEKKKSEFNQLEFSKNFINELKNLSPKVKPIKSRSGGNLLEIDIFDLHFGKMAWKEETGDNWDTKIAAATFSNAIDDILTKVKGYDIERILFPIGNDFFNSDHSHPYNRTTNGTPQEEDLRWQKTFREGRELLIKEITKLSQIAPVDIIIIPGNHDWERTFYLGDSLEGWFFNNSNVTVNNLASPRKYYQYGSVLIGFTHGNNEKVETLPIIMSQECSEIWNQIKYKEFHLGHYHHKKDIKYSSINEHNGIVIRYMSSLTAPDSWHHKKGYIGSQRSAEAFIWDKDYGLQAQLFFNL